MRNILGEVLACAQVLLNIYGTGALQCYSCKASGVNEIDANIRCLGKAYLENCDEFYNYYNDVKDQDALSYEYYDYVGEYDTQEDTQSKERSTSRARSRDGGKVRSRDGGGKPRGKRQANERRGGGGGGGGGGGERRGEGGYQDARGRENDKYSLVANDNYGGESDGDRRKQALEDEYEEYEYYDLNFTNILTTTERAPTPKRKVTMESYDNDYEEEEEEEEEEEDDEELEPALPKDPEHYCYSTTKRGEWESYTVEKGCKKIMYCESLRKNNPDWTNPWNFCCGKSRCNAKLVVDQPQRIFGMKCRRTDDCIQGHTNRPICAHYYKSCPKITTMVIKMECRDKMVSRSGKFARYQFQSRDKKCYCSPDYRPRGPICASSAETTSLHSARVVSIVYMLFNLLHVVF